MKKKIVVAKINRILEKIVGLSLRETFVLFTFALVGTTLYTALIACLRNFKVGDIINILIAFMAFVAILYSFATLRINNANRKEDKEELARNRAEDKEERREMWEAEMALRREEMRKSDERVEKLIEESSQRFEKLMEELVRARTEK